MFNLIFLLILTGSASAFDPELPDNSNSKEAFAQRMMHSSVNNLVDCRVDEAVVSGMTQQIEILQVLQKGTRGRKYADIVHFILDIQGDINFVKKRLEDECAVAFDLREFALAVYNEPYGPEYDMANYACVDYSTGAGLLISYFRRYKACSKTDGTWNTKTCSCDQ